MASSGGEAAAPRPRVALLYTYASALSRESEQSARYMGLCMATSGQCEKVFVVGLDPRADVDRDAAPAAASVNSKARRSDGIALDAQTMGANYYEETLDYKVLAECHVWILLLDSDTTATSVQFLQKRVKKEEKKQPKRIVVSLQTTMRQLTQLDQAFGDSIVLHGGLGFQVVKGDDGVLAPLSEGCYFVERLAKEKVDALYVLDLLEGTGHQVLSRRNIQALKWGTTMLRTFYYINALTGESVATSLRDRNLRLLFVEALHEMSNLFSLVMESNSSRQSGAQTNTSSWLPDTIACTYLSIHAMMVLLPLPNLLFNAVLKLIDFGLYRTRSGFSVTQRDMEANLLTSFSAEFQDVFELASNRSMTLPVLDFLKTTLEAAAKSKSGVPRISSSVMVSKVVLSRQSRAASRLFFLKLIITIVATVLLGAYLFS